MESQITQTLRAFIVDNYLFGNSARLPTDDASLLEAGIIDSTGVLELIEFLESEFGLQVEDTETLPENLGSIGGLTRYVTGKQRRQGAA